MRALTGNRQNNFMKKETPRPLKDKKLSELARMIDVKIWYGAEPYVQALKTMSNISEDYGQDSGTAIVAGFLANATTMKGDIMRAIKAELNARLKEAYNG
jgi:sulfatase maturation enzyme AslB (radical SAM superfamily)